MAKEIAEVLNAADEVQVSRSRRKEGRSEIQRLDCYALVLATYEGRAMLWDVLAAARLYESCASSDPLLMAMRAGRQEFGQVLRKLLIDVDEVLFYQMETEARARVTRAAAATRAAHIPAVDRGE